MAEDENIDHPNENNDNSSENKSSGKSENITPLSGMYQDWFLDYASYVIMERAVPALQDGLKPVQRRILHSMKEMDDGRYNKVANIIGNSMKFHPHGDASIGDALVQLGQKELLIDCQGNWGNILTGDSAAASRYIEARLSKFALHTVFNGKTTKWLSSYDGRNKEPEHLPVKFPLLLAQGAEGIAVGLACKILPHNFIELIDGSIDILRGKNPKLLPDFPQGGMADFTNYNDGLRGGKVRIRAKIDKLDSKTLVIKEIPYYTTTTSLIDSILKANDKGKIKIKKIEDNTAAEVEIYVQLATGVSPDKTIDALYAFTDCEVSISPNVSVIDGDKPRFMGVTEILKFCTQHTMELLKWELEIKKAELEEQWHFASLEKIFIEKRIYRRIEEEETWEGVISTIDEGLKPHIKHLKRKITEEDIVRLTEIKIKRISKFDSFKADELIARIEEDLTQTEHYLNNIVEYSIDYYKDLKKKFGEGKERRTEIKVFDTISAKKVIVSNKKLYVDYEEGFIGHSLKKAEYVQDCSEIDDVIVFFDDGKMMVTQVADKKFVGKNIIYCSVWKKGDTRKIYHLIYEDGKSGPAMVKRFAVKSITRDKEYDLTKGTKGTKVLYFSAHPNGEQEIVHVQLRARSNLKKLKFDVDFAEILIKGRGAKGNILTKEKVSKITQKELGGSTLAARKIWFDDVVQRLNDDGRGKFLGRFKGDDQILTLYKSGHYRLTNFDLSNRFEDDLIHIEKWNEDHALSAVYFDGEKDMYYVKRFKCEVTSSNKKVPFISESEDSFLSLLSTAYEPIARIIFNKQLKATKNLPDEVVNLAEFIDVKGMKAQGNQLTKLKVKEVILEHPIGEGETPWPDEQEEENQEPSKEEVSENKEGEHQPEKNEVKSNDSSSSKKKVEEKSEDEPDPDDESPRVVEFDIDKKKSSSDDDEDKPTDKKTKGGIKNAIKDPDDESQMKLF